MYNKFLVQLYPIRIFRSSFSALQFRDCTAIQADSSADSLGGASISERLVNRSSVVCLKFAPPRSFALLLVRSLRVPSAGRIDGECHH